MSLSGVHAWQPEAWETFGTLLLRQRYGLALTPVPDQTGGDGGLDAFSADGVAWQCYCTENEPLKATQRYPLQRDKITADLKKLKANESRVSKLLGGVVLTDWVLLTPRNESAELVAHCATKTEEVKGWGLPFIDANFRVSVQTEADFAVESRMVQAAGIMPDGLGNPSLLPEVGTDGVPFADTAGPTITVMDSKLKPVIPNDVARATYRGELLKAQIAGEDHLDRFDQHVPDIATELRTEISLAKRSMIMKQATGDIEQRTHLRSIEADVVARVCGVAPELRRSAAEIIAQASITRWLQECSMTFVPEGETDVL